METAEYVGSFLPRIIRRAGVRVGEDGPAELPGLLAARAELDEAIVTAIADMRERYGFSWSEIARELGTTRQAAQATYGPKIRARVPAETMSA
jgi:hypothetical protein